MPWKSKIHDPLPAHARKQLNARRGRKPKEKGRLYDTPDWRMARAAHIAENPLCAECERHGRATAGVIVDHIRPHDNDPDLFFDPSNWQTLCRSCHSTKTTTKDHRGFSGGRRRE